MIVRFKDIQQNTHIITDVKGIQIMKLGLTDFSFSIICAENYMEDKFPFRFNLAGVSVIDNDRFGLPKTNTYYEHKFLIDLNGMAEISVMEEHPKEEMQFLDYLPANNLGTKLCTKIRSVLINRSNLKFADDELGNNQIVLNDEDKINIGDGILFL